MNAYQSFLDFFSVHNKERLDGLSESNFTAMTQAEREIAFNHLLKLVEAGGTEESVNGLFRVDRSRAVIPVKRLLETGVLSAEAQIAAAWNFCQIQVDDSILTIFIQYMAGPDRRLRAKAAYYVPAAMFTSELKSALQGMIRTETEQLARIHAVDKLLECYGVTEESLEKNKYLSLYRGLHSEDVRTKEAAFKQLDDLDELKES
jgi:hypothetical protein